jgi:signal transduction histidine kinase/ActR/RegA family two-component response regulator
MNGRNNQPAINYNKHTMKRFYFSFLIGGTAFFLLLRYSVWWSLLAIGAAMLFSVYHFYLTRLQGVESRNASLQREVEELHVQLDSSILKEQRAQKEAETAKNVKRHLLAKVNHEIRTPMNGMLGMTSLLVETPLNHDQREYIDTIRYCGENLLTTVNDILVSDMLNFSKSEREGEELEKRDFELRNCVEEALMIFAGKTGSDGPELAYCIRADVPEQVNGDRKRLSQVLMNLLENAVRYTPQGEIFLDIHSPGVRTGNMVELAFEIRDTGCGIPAGRIDQLFKGITPNDLEQEKGPVGLGLVVCKKLVELMGGTIRVESEPGKGTRFTFNIFVGPALKPKHSPLHPGSPAAGKKIIVSPVKNRDENKKRLLSEDFAKEFPLRILVAEDNAVNQKLIMTVLSKLGYTATLAHNGKEVLELVDHEPYDLILMDVQMPEMDGIEATKMLRLCLDRQPVIIAMTANAMNGDQDICIQAGMDDYICKPVNLDELLMQLEKWGAAIRARRTSSI